MDHFLFMVLFNCNFLVKNYQKQLLRVLYLIALQGLRDIYEGVVYMYI